MKKDSNILFALLIFCAIMSGIVAYFSPIRFLVIVISLFFGFCFIKALHIVEKIKKERTRRLIRKTYADWLRVERDYGRIPRMTGVGRTLNSYPYIPNPSDHTATINGNFNPENSTEDDTEIDSSEGDEGNSSQEEHNEVKNYPEPSIIVVPKLSEEVLRGINAGNGKGMKKAKKMLREAGI